MTEKDIAYCGLNCYSCKMKFAKVKEKAVELKNEMDNVNFDEIAKVIPFMKFRYNGFKKIMKLFNNEECPGCRNGGGNPFCGIRKCASKKKKYFSCAECESLCKKFNMLFKIHIDNEIQNNIQFIKKNGIDSFVNKYNKVKS